MLSLPFWVLEKNFGKLETRREMENMELVSSLEDVLWASNPSYIVPAPAPGCGK